MFTPALFFQTDELTALRVWESLPMHLRAYVTKPTDHAPDSVNWLASTDGMSVYGITEIGEIVGIMSLTPGRGDLILRDAVKCGGRWLGHFDNPHLNDLYARNYFEEAARYEFDDDQAPDGWHPSQGRPDYIIREYC